MQTKLFTPFLLLLWIAPLSAVFSQKIDTLYYSREWKSVPHKAFATYYRILELPPTQNAETPKLFRDFYLTGEVRAEGHYIKIDPENDENTVFDGEYTSFYKSGGTLEHGFYLNGMLEGDYTKFYENGRIELHTTMRQGKSEGIETHFNREGDVYTQIEMRNGEPINDYYTHTNREGYARKIALNDDVPIWESPALEEIECEFRNGTPWSSYVKNGLFIAMSSNVEKDGWRSSDVWINVAIYNGTGASLDFDPICISGSTTTEKGREHATEIYSAEEYVEKIRRKDAANAAVYFLVGTLSAVAAGFSTATTNTYTTYQSTSGTIQSAVTSSTTTSYNPALASKHR